VKSAVVAYEPATFGLKSIIFSLNPAVKTTKSKRKPYSQLRLEAIERAKHGTSLSDQEI
jgi:hypothetical protein